MTFTEEGGTRLTHFIALVDNGGRNPCFGKAIEEWGVAFTESPVVVVVVALRKPEEGQTRCNTIVRWSKDLLAKLLFPRGEGGVLLQPAYTPNKENPRWIDLDFSWRPTLVTHAQALERLHSDRPYQPRYLAIETDNNPIDGSSILKHAAPPLLPLHTCRHLAVTGWCGDFQAVLYAVSAPKLDSLIKNLREALGSEGRLKVHLFDDSRLPRLEGLL